MAKLNRDFQKYAQMSIRRFIIEIRLNFAKSKIKEEKLPVAEIAEMCGFESIAYFYAFFKQNTGMTPHEYANNIKQ